MCRIHSETCLRRVASATATWYRSTRTSSWRWIRPCGAWMERVLVFFVQRLTLFMLTSCNRCCGTQAPLGFGPSAPRVEDLLNPMHPLVPQYDHMHHAPHASGLQDGVWKRDPRPPWDRSWVSHPKERCPCKESTASAGEWDRRGLALSEFATIYQEAFPRFISLYSYIRACNRLRYFLYRTC